MTTIGAVEPLFTPMTPEQRAYSLVCLGMIALLLVGLRWLICCGIPREWFAHRQLKRQAEGRR